MYTYSFIIPVYNKEKYLIDTFNSFLEQTYRNFELIIINDGSTDGSLKIIEEYDFKDIPYTLYSKENGGVSAARNDGLKFAKGDYVIFNDADDIIYPNFLEEFDKLFNSSKIDIAYCFRDLKYQEQFNFEKDKVFEGSILKEYISSKIRPSTNGFVISKKIILTNGIYFDEDLNWGEDILFFSKLLYFDKVTKCINKRLILKDNDLNNSLSEININKIDKDYMWMKRLVSFLEEKESKLAKDSIKLIWGYRFPSAAINILSNVVNKESINNVKHYYCKYANLINGISNVNGARSLKLKFQLLKLKFVISHLE